MPTPEITWIKNDKIVFNDFKSFDGSSILHLKAYDKSIEGQYACLARNLIGFNIATAQVTLNKTKKQNVTLTTHMLQPFLEINNKTDKQHQTTLFTCYLNNSTTNNIAIAEQRRVKWLIGSEEIFLTDKNESINLMNNGSLIFLYKALVRNLIS